MTQCDLSWNMQPYANQLLQQTNFKVDERINILYIYMHTILQYESEVLTMSGQR